MKNAKLSLDEAARRFGVTTRRLHRAVLLGELAAERVDDERHYLIASRDLIAYLGRPPEAQPLPRQPEICRAQSSARPKFAAMFLCILVVGLCFALAREASNCFSRRWARCWMSRPSSGCRGLERDPKNAMGYIHRGFARRAQRDYVGAIRDYHKALELEPSGYTTIGLGCIEYDKGDWTQALKELRKGVVLSPKDGDWAMSYIWAAHVRLGEGDAGAKELGAYFAGRRPGKEGSIEFQVLRYLEGRLSEEELKRAVESVSPKDLNNYTLVFHFNAGVRRLAAGNREAAKECFQRCLQTGARDWYEYASAVAELDRLSR